MLLWHQYYYSLSVSTPQVSVCIHHKNTWLISAAINLHLNHYCCHGENVCLLSCGSYTGFIFLLNVQRCSFLGNIFPCQNFHKIRAFTRGFLKPCAHCCLVTFVTTLFSFLPKIFLYCQDKNFYGHVKKAETKQICCIVVISELYIVKTNP